MTNRKNVLDKNINVKHIFLFYIIFAIVFIFIVIFVSSGVNYKVSDLFHSDSTKIYDNISNIVVDQNKTVDKLNKAVLNDSYTIDDPYILVNPFGLNPLSAVIIFSTPEETSVSVNINDKVIGETETSISHIIPIYGLYSNVNNSVILTLSDGTIKDLTIETDEVNSNHQEIGYELCDSSNLSLRKIDMDNSTAIKGFDTYDSIRYVIEGINDISALSFEDDDVKLLVDGIIVTVDKLGRISKISTDDTFCPSDIIEYATYSKGIKNYTFKKLKESNDYSNLEYVNLEDVSGYLSNSNLYAGAFDVTLSGGYFNISIENEGTLIFVRSDGKIFETDIIDNSTMIINENYEYALYYKIDDAYYNLNTIIKNV